MIDYSTIFNSQNIFYWILIGGILLFLTYSMIIIKNEKKTYLKNAKIYNFNQFQLKVPTWWTELPVEVKNLIQFERTDTRYDWKAFFQILNQPLGKCPKHILKNIIEEKNIIFDSKEDYSEGPFYFKNFPNIENWNHARWEGMATENGINRVYIDIMVLKESSSNEYLLCLSRSSILNGSVEGPFFDELIKQLALN